MSGIMSTYMTANSIASCKNTHGIIGESISTKDGTFILKIKLHIMQTIFRMDTKRSSQRRMEAPLAGGTIKENVILVQIVDFIKGVLHDQSLNM